MDTDTDRKGCCGPSRGEAAVGAVPLPELSTRGSEVRDSMPWVHLDGGAFSMGDDSGEIWPSDGEAPVRETVVSPFALCATAVTIEQFAAFVEDTGYVTEAERFGWSYVFTGLLKKSKVRRRGDVQLDGLEWWFGVEGASWKKPEGPGSNIKKRLAHPVSHVSWNDAAAFCAWAGVRLPTEAEWEFACRGGLERKLYPWGDDLTPNGKHRCNIWQGQFPHTNTEADGYFATAPAKSYPANGYGFYNMTGNVWEWCADWFDPAYSKVAPSENPTGPQDGERKVIRGGSYLCHASYCNRYRCSARTGNTPDSSTGHCGFRVARDV